MACVTRAETDMTFEFVIPPIVDPDGVGEAARPRAMRPSSARERDDLAVHTGGEPLSDFDGNSNPYIDYQSIDLLLSLQHPRSQGYDEMCFILMGQTKELLFKSLYFELYNARLRIIDDDVPNAMMLLTRADRLIGLIENVWDVLNTISADGFRQFRDQLGVASGQQSFMYRHVEFVLGNKSRRMCKVHRNVSHIYPALRENLNATSLYDEVLALLARRGYEIPSQCLQRDWSAPYEVHDAVEAAWEAVYATPSSENDLYQLGELLTRVSETFSVYRWRHFVTVQKILGMKAGSGGSAGVGWLRAVVDHRFFPELWSIRTRL